jgi:hypothetical protein
MTPVVADTRSAGTVEVLGRDGRPTAHVQWREFQRLVIGRTPSALADGGVGDTDP